MVAFLLTTCLWCAQIWAPSVSSFLKFDNRLGKTFSGKTPLKILDHFPEIVQKMHFRWLFCCHTPSCYTPHGSACVFPPDNFPASLLEPPPPPRTAAMAQIPFFLATEHRTFQFHRLASPRLVLEFELFVWFQNSQARTRTTCTQVT